jgi:hypothetical protein
MIWPRLAEKRDGRTRRDRRRQAAPLRQGAAELAPLKPDIAAVERMSDSTGMLQHSIYSVPDRRHGYCIDDNARALILMSRSTTSTRRCATNGRRSMRRSSNMPGTPISAASATS